jgi:ATP-dependent DNA helicase PIF1
MATLPALVTRLSKPRFYAVKKGRTPGVYESWAECEPVVSGFAGAEFRAFDSREGAAAFMDGAPAGSEEVLLSPDQNAVFEKYLRGENVFMTGPGGTGKSRLIRHIVSHATANGTKVQVCALTGCAAVLLECNAKTVHSWSGIGMAKGDMESIVKNVCQNKFKKGNWTKIDILIIDEVSMMSLRLFEILQEVAQRARRSRALFGGLQVIFSGDFYQLPPVGDDEDKTTKQFCFESPTWPLVFKNQMRLTTMFRQKDPTYCKVLNQIRVGRISRNSIALLQSHLGRPTPTDCAFKPTLLFPMRHQVDKINNDEMARLGDAESRVYSVGESQDLPMTKREREIRESFNPEFLVREAEILRNNILCDHRLELKVGAQVMCVANIDMEGKNPVCNGSQGIVVRFEKDLPVVEFNSGAVRTMDYHDWVSEVVPGLGVRQIPLILAWAITIHKSQGATLEMAKIDIGNGIFECGQTYVALSRIKSLDGLYLQSFQPHKIRVRKIVNEYYSKI